MTTAHRARKRFGQNFLRDEHIIGRIVQIIHPHKTDHLVEIGPGQGAITKPLLESGAQLDAIEIDRDLVARLQPLCEQHATFHLHSADALTFNFPSLMHDQQKIRVLGNLPYNISTPLLFHLLDNIDCIFDLHLMLQQEVVDRICAPSGNKTYGRLSVMVQAVAEVTPVLQVPATAFMPQPKVASSVVRIKPYETSPYPPFDLKQLSDVVRAAFSARRKTLRNNLTKIISQDDLLEIGIDPGLRAEQLTVHDFIKITNHVAA